MSVRHKFIERCLASLFALVLATAGAAAETSEPPALAERVKNGGLPPTAQRLPDKPRVVKVDSIGRHGGDLRACSSKFS